MRQGTSYPIEDFLEAITAQLDKTQDALRLKSVNRPLTFALKDFNLDLQVFVEMDEQGQIMFRPSRPNEQGASTVNIGFTTITRSMIEENTVSMELTKSPTLEEVGLEPEERRQLERLGVRNAAQLKQLESQAGDNTMSRMSGVNITKLRQALQMGRPHIERIHGDDVTLDNNYQGNQGQGAGEGNHTDVRQRVNQPAEGRVLRPNNRPAPVMGGNQTPTTGRIKIDEVSPNIVPSNKLPQLNISERTRKLKLQGGNLLQEGRSPRIRLDKKLLNMTMSHEDEVEIELPEQTLGGVLEIELPDGTMEAYQLFVNRTSAEHPGSDPWLPSVE